MGRGGGRDNGGGRDEYDDDYDTMRGERDCGDRRINSGGGGRGGDYYEDEYDQRSDLGYSTMIIMVVMAVMVAVV